MLLAQAMLLHHPCQLTWNKLQCQRPPFLRCRSHSSNRLSQQPFSTSMRACINPQVWPKDHYFLLRPHNHLLRRPSKLGYKMQLRSTPRAVQHGVDSSSTLSSNLPPASLGGMPGTSPPAHNLAPLPQKFQQCITKCEYIDFAVLLSDNLYPYPSLTTQNQYKLEINPQDPSAFAIIPSQHRKRWVDGLHSWLEA